ncbi:amidohydrolase [bacterium]|nr:amidohydrolase [bacterium]
MPNESIATWQRDPTRRGSLGPLAGSKYPLIDAHLHAVSFIQDTPDGADLIRAMDRGGVGKAVIFGLPVAKLWAEWDREAPDYYLANDAACYYYGHTDVLVARLVQSLPVEQRARLYPLICGFNPVDRFALRDVQRMLEWFPGVWAGIGELLLRHDDLTAFTYGEPARANHRALWPIYDFAAEHDLPVLIHQNVTAVSRGDHPLYLYEFEEALRDFPRTRFVLAHCGISRRVNVPFYHQMIWRLLEQFPQAIVDYSWIIFDVIICPEGKPQEPWLELTERFSDRICLGSDLVARFERLGPEMQRYDVFLDQLSEQARANICWNTAERVYGRREAERAR